MTRYFCDRCGKETEKFCFVIVQTARQTHEPAYPIQSALGRNVCPDCAQLVEGLLAPTTKAKQP